MPTRRKRRGMIFLMGLALAMVGMPRVAFAGGKHFGTVERKPAANATADTSGKPCVIDLTAPKEKGHCELGPNDPPAQVVVNGWFDAGHLGQIANGFKMYSGNEEKRFDLIAQDFLQDFSIENGRLFTPAGQYMEVDSTEINPSECASKSWQNDNVYTSEEMDRQSKRRSNGQKHGNDTEAISLASRVRHKLISL